MFLTIDADTFVIVPYALAIAAHPCCQIFQGSTNLNSENCKAQFIIATAFEYVLQVDWFVNYWVWPHVDIMVLNWGRIECDPLAEGDIF